MIIVTGGAGFIGSNIIKGLNAQGIIDILVVDNLSKGQKCHNLADLNFKDYMDKQDFLQLILKKERLGAIQAVFHQGACSDTTEWDGRYLMENNYTYSKHLLQHCIAEKTPFFYASSASVYGNGSVFIESRAYEKPINMYGFSKFQFDQYVRSLGNIESQVVGLRYFNVYGPGEAHKGSMASVVFHFSEQLRRGESIKLFDGCGGYSAGEQKRDFIHVADVVAVNLWLLEQPHVSGIFNLGTGHAQSFNEVANAIIASYGFGEIEYIPFPNHLKGAYQSYTRADITQLRSMGYASSFITVEMGTVKKAAENFNKTSSIEMTSIFRSGEDGVTA